ncbi:MAG: putative ATP-grasp superfamily ATP-dependent carboligase [bacterium]|jgi:predicted ATP-grasp superfamily ATP-dependent carboligase
MKKLLLTGGRAPVTLDLARLFHATGWKVLVADSIKFPICKSSNAVSRTFLLPPPKTETKAFIERLKEIIQHYEIDYLLPTCEEVFFISRYRDELSPYCKVLCDDFDKIKQFHHKYTFTTLAKDLGIKVPLTNLVESKKDLFQYKKTSKHYVFKPAYSRFATETKINPSFEDVIELTPTRQQPWVAQEFIQGKEYCSYGFAIDGKLKAFSCYHPLYRVGKGSGIYFKPVDNLVIQKFVKNFVEKFEFTGQIGFDFMENSFGEVFVLECNPRATSGLHLFDLQDRFEQVLDPNALLLVPDRPKPKMVAIGMKVFGFPYGLQSGGFSKFKKAYIVAEDIMLNTKDPKPFFYQLVTAGEILKTSLRKRVSLLDAATSDIEWNGEDI